MRILWLAAGLFWLAFGIVGAFLPLVPTVGPMLLAAFCFSRSSERLHHWIITHPQFGPPIIAWNEHGTISRRAKKWATVSMTMALGLSLILGLRPLILAVQGAVLCAVALFLWTRPEG